MPKCTACCVEIAVGRRKVPQRSSKWAIALWEALAWAERTPLWGSDDVSAMRNYRYRHRDSPYVAKRSGERTSRAGRPWAVGGNFPERGGAEGLRAREVVGRAGDSGGTNARVSVFFHPHPPSVAAQGTAAGRKGGPISSASGYFSSLCWSWGRRAGRRRRGAARARRGEEHRPCGAARGHAQGVKPNCAAWVMIRAGAQNALRSCGLRFARRGKPFAQPWASALSERPFRPRRKPRAPVRTWPQRPG